MSFLFSLRSFLGMARGCPPESVADDFVEMSPPPVNRESLSGAAASFGGRGLSLSRLGKLANNFESAVRPHGGLFDQNPASRRGAGVNLGDSAEFYKQNEFPPVDRASIRRGGRRGRGGSQFIVFEKIG